MRFFKTLLGIESKLQSLKDNLPNILAAMGRSCFTFPECLKQIKRFKLSKEDEFRVRMGLEALGLFLVWKGINQTVNRVVNNTEDVQGIIQQISNKTQDAFIQQLLDDGLPPNVVTDINNSIIFPLYDDIASYLLNPEVTFPGFTYRMGIISIVLLRVLGEQKARDVIEGNLVTSKGFQYFEIQIHFDTHFTNFMKSICQQGEPLANQLDDMFSEYLASA